MGAPTRSASYIRSSKGSSASSPIASRSCSAAKAMGTPADGPLAIAGTRTGGSFEWSSRSPRMSPTSEAKTARNSCSPFVIDLGARNSSSPAVSRVRGSVLKNRVGKPNRFENRSTSSGVDHRTEDFSSFVCRLGLHPMDSHTDVADIRRNTRACLTRAPNTSIIVCSIQHYRAASEVAAHQPRGHLRRRLRRGSFFWTHDRIEVVVHASGLLALAGSRR